MKTIIAGAIGAVAMLGALLAASEAALLIDQQIEKKSTKIAIGRTPGTEFPATHKAFRSKGTTTPPVTSVDSPFYQKPILPVPGRASPVIVEPTFPWHLVGSFLRHLLVPVALLGMWFLVLGLPFTLINVLVCLMVVMMAVAMLNTFGHVWF